MKKFESLSKKELTEVSSTLRKLLNKVTNFKDDFEKEVEDILTEIYILMIRKSEVIK